MPRRWSQSAPSTSPRVSAKARFSSEETCLGDLVERAAAEPDEVIDVTGRADCKVVELSRQQVTGVHRCKKRQTVRSVVPLGTIFQPGRISSLPQSVASANPDASNAPAARPVPALTKRLQDDERLGWRLDRYSDERDVDAQLCGLIGAMADTAGVSGFAVAGTVEKPTKSYSGLDEVLTRRLEICW